MAASYVLSSFSQATHGTVQYTHSVPIPRVPAFDPSLVIKRQGDLRMTLNTFIQLSSVKNLKFRTQEHTVFLFSQDGA